MLKDFGQDLKFLRESKNITIAEISAQTRINPKFITNMEEGNFDFQPETYIRAFLKEYAKSINENVDQVLNDYGKAKAGFYSKRKITKDQSVSVKTSNSKDEVKEKSTANINEKKKVERIPEPSLTKERSEEKTPQEKYYDKEKNEEYSNKTLTQRILLILVIIVGIAVLFYLYKTLNKPDKHSSEIKPKSFSEISEDYENKIKGRPGDSTGIKKDSVSQDVNDSLKLTIKAYREVRIKIYLDEKRIIEEVIQPKDSLNISALQQFRFSASSNSSLDLYLNGKILKKPSTTMGNSIKNLIIKKEGIISQ